MHKGIIALAAAVAVLLTAVPAISHHSNSAYEVEKVVTLVGVVKEWTIFLDNRAKEPN